MNKEYTPDGDYIESVESVFARYIQALEANSNLIDVEQIDVSRNDFTRAIQTLKKLPIRLQQDLYFRPCYNCKQEKSIAVIDCGNNLNYQGTFVCYYCLTQSLNVLLDVKNSRFMLVRDKGLYKLWK